MLIDNPPALEGQTSSEIIANHLNMIAATVIARENKQILIKYGGTYLKVYAWRLQYVKDVKMLPECEIEDEKDQTNISKAKVSKNETLDIHDVSSLSTTSSNTLVNEENSQSSDSNSQNIPSKNNSSNNSNNK